MRAPVKVLLLFAAVVLLLAGWRTANEAPEGRHHTRLEHWLLRGGGSTTLPYVIGTYVVSSGRCGGCHGSDSMGLASVDSTGRDVNVTDDWRSTMMANSARDPFFRAKLQHEVLVNPGHQGLIEGKCLRCHAPLGHFEEALQGNPPLTAAMLDTSVFGLDGVSCLACHMQNPDSAGHYFSGDLHLDSARVYGPYQDDDIVPQIMQFFVRFTPGYGAHIQDGRVCAGCHSLVTETIDLQGNLTGGSFIEQATWHEWRNSAYDGTAQNCRSCHMPRLNDSIILAAEYAFLSGHAPFGLHHLAGGNTYMLRLLRDNATALDVKATDVQFDSTIARSLHMLRERTLDIDLSLPERDADTARFRLALTNLAGHKFPSGYPSRRAFVTFVVLDDQNDTLFKSGLIDGALDVEGHDAALEPHHQVIRDPGQAQVYEMVMGDVNGDVTTVLERAATMLKDNRLVPAGFSVQHPAYDTTAIVGNALSDPDFNHDALGTEGNGGDVVHYHVPLGGYAGALRARAWVYYQPVPPRWNQEMFALSGDRIDPFRDMVNAADGTPELVAADTLYQGPLALGEHGGMPFSLFPNPTADGTVTLRMHGGDIPDAVRVFDVRGRLVPTAGLRPGAVMRVKLPDTPGTYLLVVDQGGRQWVERVVRW